MRPTRSSRRPVNRNAARATLCNEQGNYIAEATNNGLTPNEHAGRGEKPRPADNLRRTRPPNKPHRLTLNENYKRVQQRKFGQNKKDGRPRAASDESFLGFRPGRRR